MTLNDYQKLAMTTCMDSSNNFSYMMLNLVGEVGEFASKIAKLIRKNKASVCSDRLTFNADNGYNNGTLSNTLIDDDELRKEAGDILWQLSGLCAVSGWNLEDIAQMNLDKLAARKSRGTIDGNGDNR